MNAAAFLARFSRFTGSGRRLVREIDGLRFVAIAAVVLFHLAAYVRTRSKVAFSEPPEVSWLFRVLHHGDFGVALFFIISGFVLGVPFAAQALGGGPPVLLGRYFLRRLTRLEPPYVLSLVIFYFLYAHDHREPLSGLLPHLLAGLVYAHGLVFHEANPFNAVTWSLEVEVQFYVLAPLLAQGFRIRSRWLRRGTWVALALVGVLFRNLLSWGGVWSLTLLNVLDYFALGFLLADLYVADWEQAPTKSRGWDLISLVGWPLLVVLAESGPRGALALPSLSFVLYCAALRGPLSSRAFSNRWAVTLGGMCYTLYLLHYPLISAIGRVMVRFALGQQFWVNYLLQVLLVLPPLLGVCGVFFLLVERPCMVPDWPRRLWARLRPVSPPAQLGGDPR